MHQNTCRDKLCSELQLMRSALETRTETLPSPYKSFFYGADGIERSNLLFCIADKSATPSLKCKVQRKACFFSLRDMILAFPHMHFKAYDLRDKTIQVTIDDKECRKKFRNIVCRHGDYLLCLDKLLEDYMHAAFPHGQGYAE